ncbi:MAG TPA: hypothetical protein VGP06_14530, partial [Janthinobacterium sp.]|nr:hypothetical protein [Janthinobacterium sp.]
MASTHSASRMATAMAKRRTMAVSGRIRIDSAIWNQSGRKVPMRSIGLPCGVAVLPGKREGAGSAARGSWRFPGYFCQHNTKFYLSAEVGKRPDI